MDSIELVETSLSKSHCLYPTTGCFAEATKVKKTSGPGTRGEHMCNYEGNLHCNQASGEALQRLSAPFASLFSVGKPSLLASGNGTKDMHN